MVYIKKLGPVERKEMEGTKKNEVDLKKELRILKRNVLEELEKSLSELDINKDSTLVQDIKDLVLQKTPLSLMSPKGVSFKQGGAYYLYSNNGKYHTTQEHVLIGYFETFGDRDTDETVEVITRDIHRWIDHEDVKEFYIGRAGIPIEKPLYIGMQKRLNGKYKRMGFYHMICVWIGGSRTASENIETLLNQKFYAMKHTKYQPATASGAPASRNETHKHCVYIACRC